MLRIVKNGETRTKKRTVRVFKKGENSVLVALAKSYVWLLLRLKKSYLQQTILISWVFINLLVQH